MSGPGSGVPPGGLSCLPISPSPPREGPGLHPQTPQKFRGPQEESACTRAHIFPLESCIADPAQRTEGQIHAQPEAMGRVRLSCPSLHVSMVTSPCSLPPGAAPSSGPPGSPAACACPILPWAWPRGWQGPGLHRPSEQQLQPLLRKETLRKTSHWPTPDPGPSWPHPPVLQRPPQIAHQRISYASLLRAPRPESLTVALPVGWPKSAPPADFPPGAQGLGPAAPSLLRVRPP